VHVPDPLSSLFTVAAELAAALAPRYRVLSVTPRGESPYQVDAVDLVAVLRQFGFVAPVLVGERLGCVVALLVGAWYPERVAGLILVDAEFATPPGDSTEARALRDCPPDWPRLRQAVRCPVLEVSSSAASLPNEVEAFLDALKPTLP
jgi:pimeloyl-ACP methyl ester carboxylesterase